MQDTCSHCGKRSAALKLCSRCKKASYCGAECQNSGWKGHKKNCAPPPLSLKEIYLKVGASHVANDWPGVLKWQGRMDELMEGKTDELCLTLLSIFIYANEAAISSTGIREHAISCVRLGERRVELQGKMQRFRDQGESLCDVASKLFPLGRETEAAIHLQRARDLGAAHGFFSIECQACHGLGNIAMAEGRHEDGVALLQNALLCVPLLEVEDSALELTVLTALITALFQTNAIEDLQSLLPRYRKAAKASSRREERLSFTEITSLYFRARLHEVLLTCASCRQPHNAVPLHSCKAHTIDSTIHRARWKEKALLDPPSLFRHAGSLTTPGGRCALCSTSCARTRQQCKTRPMFSSAWCVQPPRTSRFSIRSVGSRSSSSWWQPKWPTFVRHSCSVLGAPSLGARERETIWLPVRGRKFAIAHDM